MKFHLKKILVVYLFTIIVLPKTLKGLRFGAPTIACRAMLPNHGYDPQTDIPPYKIEVYPKQIYSNQTATVTIMVKSGELRFKGFMMHAKPTVFSYQIAQHPIGSFKITEGMRRLNCAHGEHNTVTHTYAQWNSDVSTVWIPPHKYNGRVTFKATVVQKFQVYWAEILSNSLNIIPCD